MTDLEQQLLSLQEEFQKLQEAAAQVEGCLERRIFELEAALRRSQHDYEVVVGEKNQLQAMLGERDDEIRYLQVELEAAIVDKLPKAQFTSAASPVQIEEINSYITTITHTLQTIVNSGGSDPTTRHDNLVCAE